MTKTTVEKKPTQCDKVLNMLKNARAAWDDISHPQNPMFRDGWVNGRYFLQTMMISQYHARIFQLQEEGHDIEASDFTDEFGFKSYRIKPKNSLF